MATDFLFPVVEPGGDGILPSQEIRNFIDMGYIRTSREILPDQIQPASIDLRLWTEAYRVRASFLPGKSTTLKHKATANGMLDGPDGVIDITRPTRLEPNQIYIIPLIESLSLPPDVYGLANPKSTTGRLDIFTRLITEYGDEFERVQRGYSGHLYLEVVSRTFPIIVQSGMRLNQLRLGRGKLSPAGDDRLRRLALDDRLLDEDDSDREATIDRGLRITVDLSGDESSDIVAYKANPEKKSLYQGIDLNKIDYYDVAEFWIPIPRVPKRQLVLERGGFYILMSKQRVRVPPDLAAELLPYDSATGEFRVHYAGFLDPGFGYGNNGEVPGTRVVLEVRANEMPVLLEDDQFVGRLHYYNMAALPDKIYGGTIGSSYQRQGLALSKQFRQEKHQRPSFISDSAAAVEKKTVSPPRQVIPDTGKTESKNEHPVLNLAPSGGSGDLLLNAKGRL
ncbi:MAG TPA: 2'-deoxycytidine 5'-triphosphate deaminase [Candidatus Koribacter sp.]